MIGYKRVKKGISELEIKRSRFIAYSLPVENEEEATAFLSELKKKHYDARHVCYAYVADEKGMIIRFSDDGEPSGTAGKPILDVIKNNDLKKSLIAVVRYFGGILLGAGGLTRAYSDSAALVVKEFGAAFMQECDIYSIKIDYSTHKKLSFTLKNLGKTLKVDYSDGVEVTLCAEKGAPVENTITEASGGKVTAQFIESRFMPEEQL